MERLVAGAKAVSAVIAAFMAILALVGWLNQAILDHLDQTFATKVDLSRIEQKIDVLSTHVDDVKRYQHDPRNDSHRPR